MKSYTDQRQHDTPDELWLLEHEPVFTQGQAGKAEHLLVHTGDIPVVNSDRGGQITYHGPGQLVAYVLLDLKRLGLGIRQLVELIECSVIELLAQSDIDAKARRDAPGVYVNENKIASLGLRVRRSCSFHGVAINFAMDISPFSRINPCGYSGMSMTQVKDLISNELLPSFESFQQKYAMILARKLGYSTEALTVYRS